MPISANDDEQNGAPEIVIQECSEQQTQPERKPQTKLFFEKLKVFDVAVSRSPTSFQHHQLEPRNWSGLRPVADGTGRRRLNLVELR